MERAALIGGVMMRKVPTDKTYAVRGDMLKKIVEEDKAAGFIPFYVRKDQHPFSYHRVNTHRQTHTAILPTLNNLNFSIEFHTSAAGLCLLDMQTLQPLPQPSTEDATVHTPRLLLKDNIVSVEHNARLSC